MNVTLVKGLAMLESLAHSRQPMGVSELARAHGLHKSNAHRVLQSLVALKYVRHDPDTGRYAPSMRLWCLGTAVLDQFDLRQAALPVMEDVVRHTHESVHITVLDGPEVIYVHKLEGDGTTSCAVGHAPLSQIGGRYPAHCVASGKAMLAFLSPDELQQRSQGLRPLTRNSITEPARFLDEMRCVRQQRFAVNRGECHESVWGVAAPIHALSGEVVGAIGISGASQNVRRAGTTHLGGVLQEAAVEIRRALGGAKDPLRQLTDLLTQPMTERTT